MSNEKQRVFAPRPLTFLKFFFYQPINMRKIKLNPNFHSKIQNDKKIMANFQIFERKLNILQH